MKETIQQTEGLCKEAATNIRNAYDKGYKQGCADGEKASKAVFTSGILKGREEAWECAREIVGDMVEPHFESAYMVEGINVSVTTSTTPSYAIGDLYPNAENPEGVVYYVYSNGTHGKIVSLINTSVKWDSRDYASNYFIGATSTTNGSSNTNKMSYSYHPIKAWIVDNLGSGWYCPARDELSTLFGERATINATLTNNGYSGFFNEIHWSSTEDNDDYYGTKAWVAYQNYGSTYVDRLSKGYVYAVRAVKSF